MMIVDISKLEYHLYHLDRRGKRSQPLYSLTLDCNNNIKKEESVIDITQIVSM
jgi:hypothetical protein